MYKKRTAKALVLATVTIFGSFTGGFGIDRKIDADTGRKQISIADTLKSAVYPLEADARAYEFNGKSIDEKKITIDMVGINLPNSGLISIKEAYKYPLTGIKVNGSKYLTINLNEDDKWARDRLLDTATDSYGINNDYRGVKRIIGGDEPLKFKYGFSKILYNKMLSYSNVIKSSQINSYNPKRADSRKGRFTARFFEKFYSGFKISNEQILDSIKTDF